MTPAARDEQHEVGGRHQLDRVVRGEERCGVEDDHVEALARRGDDLTLRGDDLRGVRAGIGDDVGDDLDALDARLLHAARFVVHVEEPVDGGATEVAVHDQHRRARFGEHRGEVGARGRLALARRRRRDHQHERAGVPGLEQLVGAHARALEQHRRANRAIRLGRAGERRRDRDEIGVTIASVRELRHLGEHREAERGLGLDVRADLAVDALGEEREPDAHEEAEQRAEHAA